MKNIKKKLKNKITNYFLKMISTIFRLFPLNENKVLFFSKQSSSLNGNLKCIYDAIPNYEYQKNMVLKKKNSHSIKNYLNTIYQLSTSKYILSDNWNKELTLIHRRKSQEIIQVWHEFDTIKEIYNNKNNNQKSKKQYTKVIAPSEEAKSYYSKSYKINSNNIKAVGFPETDIYFNKKYINIKKENFYKKYPSFKNKKIILFAPAYRGKNKTTAYYDFEMLDLNKLNKEFKNEYIFIIKWPKAIYDKLKQKKLLFNISEFSNFVFDFSDTADITDLLFVCDILITDYNPIIFNYSILEKPIIYYTYDLDRYIDKKELSTNNILKNIYQETSKSIYEIINQIKNTESKIKKSNISIKKIMSSCDGSSTKKCLDYIFKN